MMSDRKTILLAQSYLRYRYSILFYTLLLTMVAGPVLNALKLSGTLFESLLATSLLAAIMPDTVKGHRLLLVLLIVAWPARLLAVWLGHSLLSEVTLGIWTLIGFLAAVAALRFAMGAARVDGEHLYAALSAYLLAGICFGLLYWVLEQISSGTLATLGYGDIAPRADVARGLAVVEGVGGQLFLAVLVARLVSLYSKPGNESG